MRFSALWLFSLWLCLTSVGRLALAEHEFPPGGEPQEEEEEPSLRRQPNAQTLRDIQDTISRTDPRTLDALKEALSDIAQGKTVSGPLGKVALDFLEQIPDAEVGAPEAQAEPAPESKKSESLPAISANAGAPGPAGTTSAPSMVRIEAPVPQAANDGQSSILRAAESAGPGAAVFKAFPYSGSDDSGESESASLEEARQRRRARAVSEPGTSGEELASGQGNVALGSSATIKSGKISNASAISQSTQRLAGTVTSLLQKFQRRAPANIEQPGLANKRSGVFERLANFGGFTVERALAKADASPSYRKFQSATVEAGLTPSQSLGAYYAVLALAWIGTLGFLVYCLKFTPLGPQLHTLFGRIRR